MNIKECRILFENGTELTGRSLGHIGTTGGEVCFNTGMTGYQEILTDPSYSGQIINMTYPHIGNYGVNKEDVESSKIQCAGFIVKQASEFPSNFRSTSSLNDYLDKNKINSLLEIGCGYGISTWILKDITKKKIIGLDINKEAIDGAKKLFKKDDEQIDYICSDYLEYFNNNPNAYFDTIITCYGPVKKDHIEVIMKHCNSKMLVCINVAKDLNLKYEDFYDESHLNKSGSQKFADFIYKKLLIF